MGLEKLTKDEIIELYESKAKEIEKIEKDQQLNHQLLENMNKLFEKMNSGSFGQASATTNSTTEDSIPLMWCATGILPVQITDKITGDIIVTFDETWEVRNVSRSELKYLLNAYRKLFKLGKLVFVNKEDAERERMGDILVVDEDKILELLKLPYEKLADKMDDMTNTMKRTFLWHCAKRIKKSDERFTKYSYDKIEPLCKKFGNTELKTLMAKLTFVDEDYDGSDIKE